MTHTKEKQKLRDQRIRGFALGAISVGAIVLLGECMGEPPRREMGLDVNRDGICDVVEHRLLNWVGEVQPDEFFIREITLGMPPGLYGISAVGDVELYETQAQEQLAHPESIPTCTKYEGIR